MKTTIFSLTTLFICIVLGCTSGEQPAESPSSDTPPDMHTSQLALDVDGTYRGILPCADCAGIQTEITLDSEMNFVKRTVYTGRSSEVFTIEDTYSWLEDGNTIRLSGLDGDEQPAFYHVGENRLFQLDMDGNRITGDLADHYILHKSDNDLLNIYWKLIELEGEEIHVENYREPHIVFHSGENRVTGNGSCNNFFGTFTAEEDNRISFSPIASTKMACDELDTETKFLRLLEKVESYTIEESRVLLLNGTNAEIIARLTSAL
ncbi:MAG: copper resistance protein NlpE N-terminal domain-containing protein [Balneolaceae bacterium]|nr:copper resistance protein NlpE N-terminal domain-containing protein [Balneolaceae bacterium]